MRLTSREGEQVGSDKRVAPGPGDLTWRQRIFQADGGHAAGSLLLRALRGRRLVSAERTNGMDEGLNVLMDVWITESN